MATGYDTQAMADKGWKAPTPANKNRTACGQGGDEEVSAVMRRERKRGAVVVGVRHESHDVRLTILNMRQGIDAEQSRLVGDSRRGTQEGDSGGRVGTTHYRSLHGCGQVDDEVRVVGCGGGEALIQTRCY